MLLRQRLDNADVLNSVNAVDWAAIPGRAGWYSPECAAAIQIAAVTLEVPPDADSDEACLRLIGVPVDRVRAGAVLYPAVCAERVH
ncbi:hypothetical protein [Actinoallomurus sp. NPDC052274]|uniref:hypothetical protein n=1 Tax=Actinoallomurus sp. NPDC052274 TaxID=3155420 RepID=UPI00341F462C